jgi:tetratricopeptide (TPR) repeat protein
VDLLKKPCGILRIKDLVESSFQARFEDGRGLQEASTAVLLAEKDPSIPGDLKAAAWTQYGNALRFSGKLRQAESALKKASSFLTSESDPRTRANLLEITASLHRVRERFAESEACLTEAIEIHKGLGDSQAEARDLILLGIGAYDAIHFSRALDSYQRALSLLNQESNAVLYISACHGLIDTLWAAGRPQAAASAFDLAEPVFREVTEGHLFGKITWLKARILLAIGETAKAVESFAAAQPHLTELSESDLEEFEAEMAAAQV